VDTPVYINPGGYSSTHQPLSVDIQISNKILW